MNDHTRITATVVAERSRAGFLPRVVGMHYLRAEHAIYNHLGEPVPEYTGGLWEFYDLSNGGFYMAPRSAERMHVQVIGNYFDGEMSADAAGIVACLFALGALASKTHDETVIDRYHQLRAYALEHVEATQIMRAIN